MLGATYYTSYDKGHRHTVTIPDLIAVRRRNRGDAVSLRGFGQASAGAQWYRVYEQNRFVGWAWATPSDAGMFGGSCGMAIRAEAQGGWWDTLFGARNPQYDGASAWFQVWNRQTKSFAGWYLLGYFTAKRIRVVCPNLDVFTSHGQAI